MHAKQTVLYESSKYRPQKIAEKEARKFTKAYLILTDVSRPTDPLIYTRVRFDWFSGIDLDENEVWEHAKKLGKLKGIRRMKCYKLGRYSIFNPKFYTNFIKTGSKAYAEDISWKLYSLEISETQEKV